MRIYIADEGDTLVRVAKKYDVEIERLVSLNPHILSPVLNIAGQQVRLPFPIMQAGNPQLPLPLVPSEEPEDYLDDWIPLTRLKQMTETEYDVLIVGSGAGGGAALWRLCEQWGRNKKRIAMIEAGSLLLPTHARNIATLGSRYYNRYFWNPKISYPLGKTLPEFSAAKQVFALGGRTLFWRTFSPRLPRCELAGWPVTFEEMEFYYSIAERVMNVTPGFTAGSPVQEALLKRLRENGFPDAAHIPMAVDLKPTGLGEIHSNPMFSSISFLAYALHRRPFDLAVNARAVRVLTENGRAVGVKVMSLQERSYVLRAKAVVLAGSTFETPRLLLHSGLKGRAIGRYLANQSFVEAFGKWKHPKFREVSGPLGILIPQTEDRPYQILLLGPEWRQQYEGKHVPEEYEVRILVLGKVESRFENGLALDPVWLDEYGVPRIQVLFSYSEKDEFVIRKMIQAVKQIASAMGVALFSKDGQPEIRLRLPGRDYHEFGTCRMGENPSDSAVNLSGQIHGVPGLYVADNSVLPSIGGTNPTLSTVALSIRTADRIIRELH